MGFGLGTALLIYYYLRRKISRIAGLLGILVFISTPVVFRLSTEIYVDLGLAFFITAAIFAFFRYREGEYKELKWLFISSIAMGLALGTKYNALLAWFFLSLAIVFVYSKDTKEQRMAVKCGLIFFLLSLFIFSPWLIKNIILTGNPLYPLLQGIFNITDKAAQEGALSISGGTYSGIFQMRVVMYGESFWETLLIPVRYFFEGQDNNPRYFNGVLNPVLILLPPFAFLNKSDNCDKLFFTFFAIFFILVSTFLDQTRIRYILPVVPLLSTLTVMGFINILNWTISHPNPFRYILTGICFFVFTVLLVQNIFYVKHYYQKISPMNYALGKESRDDFISRHIGSYPAIKYINQHTPDNARIRLILLAGRGYYLDRIYEDDPSMGMSFISRLVAASADDKTFHSYIASLGYTHLFLRIDLFYKYLQDNYTAETIKYFLRQMQNSTEIVYNKNNFAVIKIRTSR